MDEAPPFQGPYPDYPGYGQPATNPARFGISAEDRPITLTFEMSRTEYVIPAGESVIVEFDLWLKSTLLPNFTHHEDGLTWFGAGVHPTVWKDGQLMPIAPAKRPPMFGPPEGFKP